jgi:hypothetical protein
MHTIKPVLLFALLLLAACGGGGQSDAFPPELKIVVLHDPGVESGSGRYYAADGSIHMGDVYPFPLALAHELGHALGVPHNLNPACVMYPTASTVAFVGGPCPEEVAVALGAPFPMQVVSHLAVDGALLAAIDFWNDALGRTQFVVSR